MNVGNALLDTNDRKLLRVPVLPVGTYTVDTDTTEGNFTFHVSPRIGAQRAFAGGLDGVTDLQACNQR